MISPKAEEALSTEHRFIAGVQANIEPYKGAQLRGSMWETINDDESDALRAMMASRRMYDRSLLRRLPTNQRVVVRGYERSFWFWKKQTGAVIASTLSPMEDLLDEDSRSRPVGLADLKNHIEKIAPDPKVPHLVGICSTSGFTEEARNARHEYPNITLVMVEPGADGGWQITAGDDVPPFVRQMFDPEDIDQKIDRVSAEIERRSTDLLTGGLSAENLAETMKLPIKVVRSTFEKVAVKDPELRVSRRSGSMFLYRGAPAASKEKRNMGFVDRIRELFASEGDEVSKINVLSEKRAALAQRRDRLYDDIGKLEEKEAALITEGREKKSQVVRRRLAAQVAQLRKDISRLNTSANMLNQQINVISTDIHNLTLIQQGQMAQLPDTQELTENAVHAEEMLETLRADSDLVSDLEAGVGEAITSDEELNILAEFEEPETKAAESAGESTAAPKSEERTEAADVSSAEQSDQDREPTKRRKASDPEAT